MRQTKRTREACRSGAPIVLSVFTGAGGLDLGLESAGFKHIGTIEHDELCRKTIAKNRPDWLARSWTDVHLAVKECKPGNLNLKRGELDLLAGAPPCQPYSTAAQWSSKSRRGIEDERANTLTSFLQLAKSLRPKVVLIENVPSFWGSTVGVENYIREFFEGISQPSSKYQVETKILNAANFGVPQVRRRAIVIAWNTGGSFEWPEERYASKPFTSWDALSKVTVVNPPKAKGKWADLLPSIPEGWNYQWHTAKGYGKNLFGYRTRFWSFLLKLAKDRPAWTLAAQPGPGTGPFHWDNRPLATEEMLALQTFPSSWNLEGSYRDKVRMIGNATPPLLGEIIGRAIRCSLLRHEVDEKIVHQPTRAKSRPPLSTVLPVSKKYLDMERDYPAHPGAGRGPSPRIKPSTH